MVFAEAINEYLVTGLSEALAKADTPTPPVPLVADRYVVLSALQKAIRRGDEDLALRAAASLMVGGPHAIWRRLGMIGFEDVGVANIDLVGWATVVIGKPEVRKRLGGEWKVADFLIRTLCRSAKCRAADDLLHLIECDPALADLRDELPGLSLQDRIRLATSCTGGIESQGLATWFAIGTDKIAATTLTDCPIFRDHLKLYRESQWLDLLFTRDTEVGGECLDRGSVAKAFLEAVSCRGAGKRTSSSIYDHGLLKGQLEEVPDGL
jgi:hypothetical protein